MKKTAIQLILASSSPRRIQMLRDLDLDFETTPAGIDESQRKNEKPLDYVRRLAYEKAECVLLKKKRESAFAILSADTIVVSGKQKILGKPKNKKDAFKMLKELSGKKHEVITAFCWLYSDASKLKAQVSHCSTKVKFSKRPIDFWQWYANTGESLDKAGAYAAQGKGMAFIETVEGSYSNVVGLPLCEVQKNFENLTGRELYESCRKISSNRKRNR